MIQYEVVANELRIKNSSGEHVNVRFDWPIEKVLEFDTVFVVLIDPPENVKYNRNVFGVSIDGAVIWQLPDLSVDGKYRYYSWMGRPKGELFELYHTDSWEVVANATTGKIVSKEFCK